MWRGDDLVFDGIAHTLGVGRYSMPFEGELDWEDLKPHLVTNADLPDAYMFHCMWQYRPWDADWVLSIPYKVFTQLGPGRYRVNLKTEYESGEMILDKNEIAEANWYRFDNLPYVPPTTSLSGILIYSFVEDHS